MSFVENFNVRTIGTGEKFIVFGHSFDGDQCVWKNFLPSIDPDRYTSIIFDFATTKPEIYDFSKYSTLNSHVDDLFDILDTIYIKQCTFIGHAAGGMIGLLASIRPSEGFTKLVLMATSAR